MLRVAIVGGGPAGSLTALNLKDKAEVTIFEAKQSAGFPVKCGGLISSECFDGLKKYCKADKSLINKISGAFFFSPSGKYLEVKGKSDAVVIERKILDYLLLKEAGKFADVRVKSKVINLKGNRVESISHTERRYEKYDMIVGADGVESIVAKICKFNRPEIFLAKQYLIEFESIERDMVELYFGKNYSNGFFGYAIPIDESTARVGVVSKSDPSFYLNNLVKKHPSVSERIGKNVFEINSGAIPIGLIDFVKENKVLIGDSAGMVKPYTGGGIYYLMRASEIFGEVFPNINEFKKLYLKTFSREFDTGIKIRKLYDILNDEDYDFLIKIGEDIDFSKIHMDRPSTALEFLPTMLRLIKNIPLASKILKVMI